MNISTVIRSLPDFIGSNGRSEEEILECEKQLGLRFAEDYREYLEQVGLTCFNGRELTGICKEKRLNVVAVTMSEREQNESIPPDFYVIEETGLDGVVVWQSSEGTIYATIPGALPQRICESFTAYLQQ